MHHVKIPVDGGDGQEGDAGPPVEKQHEEHGFAHCVVSTPPLSLDEVVCLDGQTEEQENVRQHQVEQEDVVGVGLPKLQLENEEVEDRCIQRQSQDENHNHDGCVDFIQNFVRGLTVLDQLVGRISHLNSVLSPKLLAPKTHRTKQNTILPNTLLQSLVVILLSSSFLSLFAFLVSKVIQVCCPAV